MHDTVLSSSEKHTWETPKDFFDSVDSVYKFDLDCCAEHETAKVGSFFTVGDNALTKDWLGRVWCNPPYGKEQILFVEHSLNEVWSGNAKTVVMLIPARTETRVWQDKIFRFASSITFIKGRLKFGGSKHNAPFPSALVVFGDCLGDIGVGKFISLK